jgi:putative SOS response-associated peptidase YedK
MLRAASRLCIEDDSMGKAQPEILRKANGRANRLCLSPSLTAEINIVVADGFYEWRKAGKTKRPVYIF